MYSPKRFKGRVGEIGRKLPDPYRSLGEEGIHFRRGSVSMIAGTPGSYKSVLALNMITTWAHKGVSSLYLSADADEFTVVRRLSGITTGDGIDVVENNIIRKNAEKYEQALGRLEGVEFEYEQFDMDNIAYRVKSYEQIYGAYPDVVVLDNLIDFVSSPMAFDEMLVLIKALDAFSKEIKCHVLILHHAKLQGGANNANRAPNAAPRANSQPPADWEIQGRLTQLPRLALTLAAGGFNLNMACVKNTNGPQYRDASHTIEFHVNQNMRVLESYANHRNG